MKIPEDVIKAAFITAGSTPNTGADTGIFTREIARWAFEQAARVAERFAEDIPDADQRVFADVGAAIRKLKGEG